MFVIVYITVMFLRNQHQNFGLINRKKISLKHAKKLNSRIVYEKNNDKSIINIFY